MADSPRSVVSPKFRVSFPAVFKAQSYEGNDPKFSIAMLFDEEAQGTKEFANMKKLANAAVKEKWGGNPPANLRSPFRKGEEKAHLEGYEPGHIFVNASTLHQPGLVGPDLQPILMESDFYAGCYARATLTAYAYDTKGNKGVAFGLQNIQKLRDGDSLTGRTAAEDDFDRVDDAEWEDDEGSDGAGF